MRIQPDSDVLAPSKDIRCYGESVVLGTSSDSFPNKEIELSEPGHLSPLQDISNTDASTPKAPVTAETAGKAEGKECSSAGTPGLAKSGRLLKRLGGDVSVTLSADISTKTTRQVTLHGEVSSTSQGNGFFLLLYGM